MRSLVWLLFYFFFKLDIITYHKIHSLYVQFQWFLVNLPKCLIIAITKHVLGHFHLPSRILWNTCNHSQLQLPAPGNPRTSPRNTSFLLLPLYFPVSIRGLGFKNKKQEFFTGYFTFQLVTNLRYWKSTGPIAWMVEERRK